MAVKQVRAQINGIWTLLTYNSTSGKYEGTLTAPSVTSYNVNSGHYYPVTIEATDMAGNVTTKDDTDASLGAALRLTVKETVKPTITITSPSNGAYITSNVQPITFQIRDEANGSGVKISSLTLQIDSNTVLNNTSVGMSIAAVTNGYDVTYTPQSALSDGSHTVKINVQDNDGNAATQTTSTYVVDTVPPSLNVTAPASNEGYINSKDYSVVGTTSDTTSGPVTVTIKLNDVDQGSVTVQSNGSFTKAITLAVGTNTIVVTTTDKAGRSTSVTRTINCDIAAPTVSEIVVSPNPVNTSGQYTISVKVVD